MLRHLLCCLTALTLLLHLQNSVQAGRTGGSYQLAFLGRMVALPASPELWKQAVEAEIVRQETAEHQNGLRSEVIGRRLEYLRSIIDQETGNSLDGTIDTDELTRLVTLPGSRLRDGRIRLLVENAVLELLLRRRNLYTADSADSNSRSAERNSHADKLNAQLNTVLGLSLHQPCLEFATTLHAFCAQDSCLVGNMDIACKYAVRAQAIAKLAGDRALQISVDRLLINCMRVNSNLSNVFARHAAMRLSNIAEDNDLIEQALAPLPLDAPSIASQKARQILALARKGDSLPSEKVLSAALLFELAEISNSLTIAKRSRHIALGNAYEPEDPIFEMRLAVDEAITSFRAEDFGRAFDIARVRLIESTTMQCIAAAAELAVIGQIASIQLGQFDAAKLFEGVERSAIDRVLQGERLEHCVAHRLQPLLSWSQPSTVSAIGADAHLPFQSKLSWGLAVGLLGCLGIAVLGWSQNWQETRRLQDKLDEQLVELQSVKDTTGTLEHQRQQTLDLVAETLREPLQAISLASRCVISSEEHEESLLRQLQTIESGSRELDGILHALSSAPDALAMGAGDLLDEAKQDVELSSVLKAALANVRQLQPDCTFRFTLDDACGLGQNIKSYPLKLTKLIQGLCRVAGKASDGGSVLIGARLADQTENTTAARLLLTLTIERSERDASAASNRISKRSTASTSDSAEDSGWAEQGIVEAIARLLGGKIAVHRDGTGINCLYLDLGVELTKANKMTKHIANRGQEPVSGSCDSTQILTCVIDDDPLVLESTVATLRALGCECSSCNGWEDAKQLLDARQYDLVVTDINMPEQDGFSVLAEVHKLPSKIRPAVVALSGETDPSVVKRINSAPFDTVVFKPYTLAQMSEVVRSISKPVD